MLLTPLFILPRPGVNNFKVRCLNPLGPTAGVTYSGITKLLSLAQFIFGLCTAAAGDGLGEERGLPAVARSFPLLPFGLKHQASDLSSPSSYPAPMLPHRFP